MKRYRIPDGRYVPATPDERSSLCQCKPWHECLSCGLVEHAGGFCSYCGSKTALRMLAGRPFTGYDATNRRVAAVAATPA